MSDLTQKQEQTQQIINILSNAQQAMNITDIRLKSNLPNKTIKTILSTLPVECIDGGYILHNAYKPQQDNSMPNNTTQSQSKPQIKRNKPFTPNPTQGYQVCKDKVKIFLDRKASSKTLTLSLKDLQELVMAVEKGSK